MGKKLTQKFSTGLGNSIKNGFFVEIGAGDGTSENTTLYLEKLGWNGIAIEPFKERFDKLVASRSCKCLNVAVYDYNGEVEFAVFPPNSYGWNGIIETHQPQHKELYKEMLETIKVPCLTWDSLNLPKNIDYLQLDAEGAELSILKNIPWDRQHITYICLEDNKKNNSGDSEYENYMKSIGYTCVDRLGQDFLWKKI